MFNVGLAWHTTKTFKGSLNKQENPQFYWLDKPHLPVFEVI